MMDSTTNAGDGTACCGKRGLTLVEIVIAIALISLTAMAFFPLFHMSQRVARRAGAMMEQTHRAQTLMEGIKLHGYHSAPLAYGTHAVADGTYTVVASASFPDAKDIHLAVNWPEPGSTRVLTIRLSTTIAETWSE